MARRKREPLQVTDEGPNLIPIMNLMTILIPFLLLSAVFIKIAVLNTSLPQSADAAAAAPEEPKEKPEDEKPKLNLTVTITRLGFTIAGSGAVLPGPEEGGPTVPKAEGAADWPYDELNKKLIEIKKSFPEEESCVIIPDQKSDQNPEGDIAYQVIIRTMDAVRETDQAVVDTDGDGKADGVLFPAVIIGAGIL